MQFIVIAHDYKKEGLVRRLAARDKHVAMGDRMKAAGNYIMGVAMLDEEGKRNIFERYYSSLFSFLEEMFNKKFSRIKPSDVFFSSDNLEGILSFFEKYSIKELKDKFI